VEREESNQNQNNNDRSRGRSGIRDSSLSKAKEPTDKEGVEERDLAFGPRIRGRSQRRAMATAVSTISAPQTPGERHGTSNGREFSTTRGLSPRRSDNGLINFASFSDSNESRSNDGSTHRTGTLFLPSATWTPPSLRHFGFPTEFKGFLEVTIWKLISPWSDYIWNILKEDSQQLPDNWREIPATRRTMYAVFAFVSGYYLLVSLYAIPLVALGFLTPAYLCRHYLENLERDDAEHAQINDNNDVNQILSSVKEMSLWLKFWVSFCGWLLASSLTPRIVAAIFPLKILTLLFVVASLVAPWTSNPGVLLFDRLLLPLFHRIDECVVTYKEKIIQAVSSAGNRRRRD